MGKIKGWSVVPVNEATNGVMIGGVMGRDGRTIPTRIENKWKNRKQLLFIRSYSGKKFELGLYMATSSLPSNMFTLGEFSRQDLAFDKAVKYMKARPYGARRI